MRSSLAGAAIFVAACSNTDVVIGDVQEVTVVPAVVNADLDVLFVVDNSPSMLEEQTSLATNFPRIIQSLSTLDGGVPNLHIGVVTSDMGTTGSLAPDQPAPSIGSGPGSCTGHGDDGELVQGTAVTGRFISDVRDPSGARQVNYTGTLGEAFGSLARVGADGCGFEQHLRAMQRGLDDHNATNAGFLRPSANLAVVIIGDEDDCSVADPALFGTDPALGPLQSYRCFRHGVRCTPDDPALAGPRSDCAPRTPPTYVDDVAPFADFLVDLKGDPRKVMLAAIVGDPAPVAVEYLAPPGGGTPIPTLAHSCTYASPDGTGTQTADPGVRFAALLDHFPGRARLTSICNPDLSDALHQVGQSTKQLVGDPCIDTTNLADGSAAEAGIQPICQAADIRDSAPDVATQLPSCATGAPDCFTLVADPVACPDTADHLRLELHRTSAVADDTWTHLRCQPAL